MLIPEKTADRVKDWCQTVQKLQHCPICLDGIMIPCEDGQKCLNCNVDEFVTICDEPNCGGKLVPFDETHMVCSHCEKLQNMQRKEHKKIVCQNKECDLYGQSVDIRRDDVFCQGCRQRALIV